MFKLNPPPGSLKVEDWTPKIMLCSIEIPEVVNAHTYIINNRIEGKGVKLGTKIPGRSHSDVILMGEKRSESGDYYVDPPGDPGGAPPEGDFESRVDLYKHGLRHGSNYLFLDGHAGSYAAKLAISGLDPWDFPDPSKIELKTP